MNNDFFIGILNGGKSSRMGFPKSLIKYKGIPLAERIFNEAKKITDNVVFIGESELPSTLKHVKVLKDGDAPGPLSAVVAAVDYKKCDWFFWAVDMPLINELVIKEILELRENFPKGVIPFNRSINIFEPYCAYYSSILLKQVTMLIDENIFSMQRCLKLLEIPGCSLIYELHKEKFHDWNTPEEITVKKEDIVFNLT